MKNISVLSSNSSFSVSSYGIRAIWQWLTYVIRFEADDLSDQGNEVWHGTQNHEQNHCPSVEQEHHEELPVFVANAGVEPRAVMVHVQNTPVAS